MSKMTAKDVMLPHSEAKVAFYKEYLTRFLSVMSVAKPCKTVNIFDVFCGRGVYEDGGLGSPIKAMETIQQVRRDHPSDKVINLYLNDKETKNVASVQRYIQLHFNDKLCHVCYYQKLAEEMLETLPSLINHTDWSTHNLVFIDPYGYKQIHKQTLFNLLENKRTEVLLFLPISFMHRFTRYAFTKNDEKAKPLKDFIREFLEEDSPIFKEESMDVRRYIKLLSKAFSFNKQFYSTHYLIQRDHKNYFALFFMTSNLLGLERAVDSMWELDSMNGKGFCLESNLDMPRLFSDDIFINNRHKEHIESLKLIILNALQKGEQTNSDIYLLTLLNGYRPTHAKEVLDDLALNNQIEIFMLNGSKHRKGAYYLNYKDANDRRFPKIRIKLIKQYENN